MPHDPKSLIAPLALTALTALTVLKP